MCSTDLEVLATRSSHAASVIMTARLLRSKCTCSIGPSNLWSTSSAYLLLVLLLLHLLGAPASLAPTTTITTTTTTGTGNPQNASWTTRQHCIQTNKERPDTGGVHAWAEWNFALTCNLTTSVRGSSRFCGRPFAAKGSHWSTKFTLALCPWKGRFCVYHTDGDSHDPSCCINLSASSSTQRVYVCVCVCAAGVCTFQQMCTVYGQHLLQNESL